MSGTDREERPRNCQWFRIHDRSPTVAVVESVAQMTKRDPLDLEPLANRIDPKALEKVVTSTGAVTVQFEWEGFEVQVNGSGEILVTEW